MSSYGRSYRPELKASVDVQLQRAFSEGLWSTVIRLANQRNESKKDPYYETIRVCAESQMDCVTERSAVVVAVDALVREKAAALDFDSLDLYEWALNASGFSYNYSQTMGVLRARWAKANPSSPAAIDCLEACVRSWDLLNAQQIAATLDKGQSGKNDGKSMFWNITLTHLLSISSQCPENMATVFAKLARMQLEKAASAAITARNGKANPRAIRGEEEINLYYYILGKDACVKALAEKNSHVSIVSQLGQGRKHLLLGSLQSLEAADDWDNVYTLCRHALHREDDRGKPSFLAFDLRVWELFVKAATKRPDVEGALNEVASTLDKFVAVDVPVVPLYKKNIGLATLELAFHCPPSLLSAPGKASSRVITLYLILEQILCQHSAFDDMKKYVGQLTFDEAKFFMEHFTETLLGNEPDEKRTLAVRVLEVKFRYFLTTCPITSEHVVVVGDDCEPQVKCKFCETTASRSCRKCLESVISAAASAYKHVDQASDKVKGLEKDLRVDLAIVLSSALLKLSGLRQARSPSRLPRLSHVDMAKLLQATAILGTQFAKTPNEPPLRLLLAKLYLLLGCASTAYEVWLPLDVKRTIQDSLSPLFFDRISTISPGLFYSTRHTLMQPLTSYYASCLRRESPVKIWDAFTSGSYTSILDMAAFSDRLRRSCTLAMTVIEERKATRAHDGRLDLRIEQSPLLAHITDDTTFVNVVDYGSFPNLESTSTVPLYKLIQLGPELTSERCRLSLLVEHFLDTINFKAPKDYNPNKANDVAFKDRTYLTETLAHLHTSLSTLLLQPSTPAKLTPAEHKYHITISLLAAFLHTALSIPPEGPSPSSLGSTTTALQTTLASLRTNVNALPPHQDATLHTLTDPHTFSLLRETATAIKQATIFLLAAQAVEQSRHRTGMAKLHKDVVADAKALEEAAIKVLVEGKNRVKALKDALGGGGWLDRVEGWMFREEEDDHDQVGKLIREVCGAAEMEEWMGIVVESWREGVKGLGTVRWE